MRAFILVLILALAGCASHSGAGPTAGSSTNTQTANSNGSSGVGNLVPVAPGVAALIATPSSVTVKDGIVADGKTGEKLLSVEKVPEAALGPGEAGQLVKSQLGSLEGFEYLPLHDDLHGANYWIVCPAAGCYKLSPLSGTNAKVPALIGSLRTVGSSPGAR